MKYEMPVILYQEKDCISHHTKELAALGSHALVLTGKNSSKKNGSLETVLNALQKEEKSFVIFDEIEENPSVETVERAVLRGKQEGTDFVIGIGGGSPLDAAKAAALLLANPEKSSSILYEQGIFPALPVAAIPTTAGTGSETTPYAILTLHQKKTKQGMSHRVFPALALADPVYLQTQSIDQIRTTAADTLAHLIESLINTKANSYSRIFAWEGLRLWGKFSGRLMEASLTEADYEDMMMAASLGGMSISHTGTSLPHGLSYPLTYELGIAHGAAAGIFLAGYLALCPQENLRTEILKKLNLTDCKEFQHYLKELLGTFKLPKELLQRDMHELLENQAKLANCPFPVTEKELTLMFPAFDDLQ